jgi:hypothetical protein
MLVFERVCVVFVSLVGSKEKRYFWLAIVIRNKLDGVQYFSKLVTTRTYRMRAGAAAVAPNALRLHECWDIECTKDEN